MPSRKRAVAKPQIRLDRQLIDSLMRMIDDGVLTLAQATKYGKVHRTTMARHRKAWLEHGSRLPPKKEGYKQGRPLKLPVDVLVAINDIIDRDALVTTEELHDDLVDAGFPSYNSALLSRTRKRLGITRRDGSQFAHAQRDDLRADYRRRMGQYHPRQLVFIDESSFDYRICNRRKAWGHRGDRTWVRTFFSRGQRFSLLAACSLDIPMFAAIIDGENMDGLDFYRWVKDALIPMCQRWPNPRSVIVMDNCAIHKLAITEKLIVESGEWCKTG